MAQSELARQNDAFRKAMGVHNEYGGRAVVTAQVAALPNEAFVALLDAVRAFDNFSAEDDPLGDHGFGAIRMLGETWFFKLDYYDPKDSRFGSENPADPAVTYRVLTVMHASEW